MALNPPPLIIAAPQTQDSTIIFLHGLADNSRNWVHLAHKMHEDTALQNTKFILPDAEERKVTLWNKHGESMPAWFNIPTWNDTASENNDQEGLEASRGILLSLVKAETDEYGIPPSRIFLGGFSQGGCVALFTAVTATLSLGGAFGLSTYLPMIDRVKILVSEQAPAIPSSRRTPVFLGHGNGDPKVKLHWAQRTANAIVDMGVPTRFEVYSGMFHQTCDKEIEDLCCFIKQHLNIGPIEET
ncbi:Phospholipase/carboxylesterase/thioesterase [Truncatella angustata]|uniref:Acyl-protein thioesterase 1 n=1 Tax=Truncatella angustata TaxID=152316 RepID=A0A9P8U9J9_9PEZI|nr:Phospholipase/carboxylesterase/thioesterase [Truncatella angustata]KAH6646384.1 Phospholipase/carboxylesterase/thioesterase [Truncatella angustata]